MNAKVQRSSTFDILVWCLIGLLVVAAFVANYYYIEIATPIRLLAWLVVACVGVSLALQTTQGKTAWDFARESRMELRKVVWPTRQETVQTTLVVAGLVIVTALILWGVDTFLLWAIAVLTGQRG